MSFRTKFTTKQLKEKSISNCPFMDYNMRNREWLCWPQNKMGQCFYVFDIYNCIFIPTFWLKLQDFFFIFTRLCHRKMRKSIIKRRTKFNNKIKESKGNPL